ncbi:MAG: ABC transporter permease subunit [Planctomycetota bacterium]|nr:ABC transporter permease subunit [Planctomycetota bacterium]
MPIFLRWLLRLGPTNPIAVRLIHNGSRRTKHLYIRAVYLGLLILVLLWALLFLGSTGTQLSYRDLASKGAESFTWIAYLQILLICVLSPVFMAGAIAQEASPRTWDILLTTPLSAPQIVLGNLIGRLFFILALLLASLPLFAITQFFGGVPGVAIFASYAIAACAALLVGAIAIALAVSRLAGRRAVFAFYVAVVSYLAVTWAFDVVQGGGARVTHFTALNPFLTLKALLNPTSYPRAVAGSHTGFSAWFLEHPVTTWCLGSMALSGMLMIASTFTVRSGGLGGLGGGSSGVPWYRRVLGLAAAGAEHRAPRAVWTNPIAWREAAARNATLGRMLLRWMFILAGGLWSVLLVYLFHAGTFSPNTFRVAVQATVWGEAAVIALIAINMAATAVSREREDGTLDLLLTTPITPSQYLKGKLRGLIAYLLPMIAVPLSTLFVAGGYVLVGGFGNAAVTQTVATVGATPSVESPILLPEGGVLAALVLIPFIAVAVMIGLQWSLKSKGTLGAVVATVGVVGVLAGIVGLCAWQASPDLQLVGPFLAAFSPSSLIYAIVDPVNAMIATAAARGELITARVALFAGCVVAGGLHLVVVYGVHSHMVRTFDMTVRRLAGMK